MLFSCSLVPFVMARLFFLSLLVPSTFATPVNRPRLSQSRLASHSLDEVLDKATPIFGNYVNSDVWTANWMKSRSDNTLLTELNIPGTHDSATWNYTQATQDALRNLTGPLFDPVFYRCQSSPLISMLNQGIRFFDLRYALDPTNTSLVFWHNGALQSESATVDSVMYGFYKWLNDHPSEVVILSFMYEGSTTPWAQNNAVVQQQIYEILTTPAAQQYIDQTLNDLPANLGAARGKIVLFRRFVLDKLDASIAASLPGIALPPSSWTDNSRSFNIEYNTSNAHTAYIEDYYETSSSGVAGNVADKFNATLSHLKSAAEGKKEDFYVSFASASKNDQLPPVYPEIMAVGSGEDEGVNQKLLKELDGLKGKRVGVVVLDFFEKPQGLVEGILKL